MDPKQLHELAGAAFREALQIAPDRRAAFLTEWCRSQPDVMREVLSLLEHHEEDSFLERPGPDTPPPSLPDRIGPYRVLRLLGWGGSGVVYLALQDRPRREIALKVLRSESAAPDALARFRRESELLARLDHPGIARVMESGRAETATGLVSFIAMEYIPGKALLEYARDLDHDGRLLMMAKLATIVDHAHRRGIVHRDLKPANVIVRDSGRPVVLDFGIARQMPRTSSGDDEWTELAGDTVTGQLLGTLAYMSPEQAAGDANSIDKRSDVYGLGVMLFELVTGKLPHDTRDKLITEAIRMIERGDPTPISHYGKQYGGDLETIVGKALRREPALRYKNAGELAEDLKRLLSHRPILARPPGRVYRTEKFLRRHRRLSALSLGLIGILMTALIASLSSLQVARVAKQQLLGVHAVTMRFSDSMLLDKLTAEIDQLWPATPENLPRFDDWLQEAEQLAENRTLHARHFSESDLHPEDPEELQQLEQLVGRIETFVGPGGALQEVGERRSFAADLEARTVGDFADAWSRACSAIADRELSPIYRGLKIGPQVGLIPLGPDANSGLWEFSLFGATGETALRGSGTGRHTLKEDTGIVFVLVPGGDFLFGAQKADRALPQFDAEVRDHESPLESVTLDPFFISKYEWTQAQWLRLTDFNPSYYADGDMLDEFVFTSLAPVESVSWTECTELLGRLGLTLPTETQWEYAARAGSDASFCSGESAAEIWEYANLNDGGTEWMQDGYRAHAPVGSFSANGFGLHDMTGNISEWCLDVFKVHCREWPLRAGDGLRLTPDGPERVRRGGGWTNSPTVSRLARRDDQLYYQGNPTLGLRPVRRLDR